MAFGESLGETRGETREMKTREIPRIGVVLCHCGTEIREALDLAQLEKQIAAMPGVVYLKAEAYPCSRPGIATLTKAIRERRLERVVIAGCTPRLHGGLLAQACESAGLNRWFVDMANIREHCSRVHTDKARATEKAKALIGASIRKVGLARSYEAVRMKPRNSVLVIGGGVSGLGVAAELVNLRGDLPLDITLIEKENTPGGVLLRLQKPYPYRKAAGDIIKEKLSKIEGKVKLLKQTEVVSLMGAPGHYLVRLSDKGNVEEHEFGAIVVATGADCVNLKQLAEVEPLNTMSSFSGRIITQIDLETEPPIVDFKTVHSVLFVSISVPELSHSGSRVYSLVALNNAAVLKETNPELEVWFLFKDVPSDLEREFARAKSVGVMFVRLDDERTIEFVKNGLRVGMPAGDSGSVRVDSAARGEAFAYVDNGLEIKGDLVVLPTFLRPRVDSRGLAERLRIPVDAHGFFIEPHIKLRPGDFIERGIFVVGSCHSPASILESSSQAMVVASRVSRFLGSEIVRTPFLSQIDQKVCRGCSRCAEACRWDAIEMTPLDNGLKLARVNDTLCTGCGVCSTVCINGAPSLAPVSQDQIRAMVEAVGA